MAAGKAGNGDSTLLYPTQLGASSVRNSLIAPQPSLKKTSSQGFAPSDNGSSFGLHPAKCLTLRASFTEALKISLHAPISDEVDQLNWCNEGCNSYIGKKINKCNNKNNAQKSFKGFFSPWIFKYRHFWQNTQNIFCSSDWSFPIECAHQRQQFISCLTALLVTVAWLWLCHSVSHCCSGGSSSFQLDVLAQFCSCQQSPKHCSCSPAMRKPTKLALSWHAQAVRPLCFGKSAPRCRWCDEISDHPVKRWRSRKAPSICYVSGSKSVVLFTTSCLSPSAINHFCQNQRLHPSRTPHAALRCPTF